MTKKLFHIDTAMNIIKDEVIKELSECVSKQNKKSYYQEVSSNNLSFFDKRMD